MKKKDLIRELEETRMAHLDTADLMDFYRSCVFDLARKLIEIEDGVKFRSRKERKYAKG